jgi:phospho-N-acetylmuramoyl-pentapeptide-transferase
MGDTGSFGLGGLIAAVAIVLKQDILLIIIGGLFVIETLSVIIQVIWFKIFKKRVFKMAPIHHHFELLGWPEIKVIIRFWVIGILFSGVGFFIYYLKFID